MITKNLMDINGLKMLNQNLSSSMKNEEIIKNIQEFSTNNIQYSPKVIFMKLPMDQFSSNKNKEIQKVKKTNHHFVEDYIQNLYKKSFGEKNNLKNAQKIDENKNLASHKQSSQKNLNIQETDKNKREELLNKNDDYSNFLRRQFGIIIYIYI